jgi:hypothetical protein
MRQGKDERNSTGTMQVPVKKTLLLSFKVPRRCKKKKRKKEYQKQLSYNPESSEQSLAKNRNMIIKKEGSSRMGLRSPRSLRWCH